jgi:hypothetical protein
MRNQKKTGDGLTFMKWVYQPGIFRRALWPIVKLGMLRKKTLTDGRTVHRMPFRKPLVRDVWEPREGANAIGEQWKNTRKSGGNLSFGESDM